MMTIPTGAPVLALSEAEEQLTAAVLYWLDAEYPEEAPLAQERFSCLRDLGAVISRYPSVRESQTLRGCSRNEEGLLQALCSFCSSERILHIPTKVAATRSYLVAKFHAFALLARLAAERPDYLVPLRDSTFSVVSTLMAEAVYFSCLEDPAFPRDVRIGLARDLVSLWDSGTDPRAIRHLPALKALWHARDAAPPAFGTMDGSSELLRITMDMGDDWNYFLIDETNNDETRWALEEFLFGLSFEEIKQVRDRLSRYGIPAVGYGEIKSYLGMRPSFVTVDETDLRTIYDFFIDRRRAAERRLQIGAPGPRRTLEEIYLKYRILQENREVTESFSAPV